LNGSREKIIAKDKRQKTKDKRQKTNGAKVKLNSPFEEVQGDVKG
jgi:hypothetical protein